MKKTCLIIIPGIPYPPINGHKLKIYNFIKILAKAYSLHIVTIDFEELMDDEATFIKKYSYKHSHFKISPISKVLKLFMALFSNLPFQSSIYYSGRVRKYLLEHAPHSDLVIFNMIRTAQYIDLFPKAAKVLDMVDLLSKSYESSMENTTSAIFKIIYSIEGKRLSKFEEEQVKKVQLTLMVNKEEAQAIKQNTKAVWIPNGVHQWLFDYNKINTAYSNAIVFLGSMYYQPNIDAVLWFIEKVFMKINPSIEFYVIGARPSRAIVSLANNNHRIKVAGFLDDPYEIVNSCLAVVAPMQNGGGIQNKILEAMALGKINILTKYAADPIIGGEDGKHFLIADAPKEMAGLINSIFESKEEYKHLGSNARDLIAASYTWDHYEDKVMKQLSALNI